MTRPALVTRAVALSALLALAACDSDLDPLAGNGEVEPTFSSLYGDYFQECKNCHQPGAEGSSIDGIEQSLDFSTRQTAYATITQESASGLQGISANCDGVPFVGGSPGDSLILAVLDQDVRRNFDRPAHPDCEQNAISDMTVKVGKNPSPEFLDALATWIEDGAPNN